MQGDAGADTLIGGAGADAFRYVALTDSQVDVDTIVDFNPTQGDSIDLSRIDANVFAGDDQSFTFIGNAAFTGTPGQLQYDSSAYGVTWVRADVNGDGISDLNIALAGNFTLTAANFMR